MSQRVPAVMLIGMDAFDNEVLAAVNAHLVPCPECGGTGRDRDGTICVECGGEPLVVADPQAVRALLAGSGLSEMSTDDLAAHVCLVAAFGPEWRDVLGTPTNASPIEVWIEVLLALAETPEEGDEAVQHWWHGTGPWTRPR